MAMIIRTSPLSVYPPAESRLGMGFFCQGILHLAKAGSVWCGSSCEVPTATGRKAFSALCKLGKSVPFQCCRRCAHDRMPPDNKLCSNYWHWHSSQHLHEPVAHLVIEILLLTFGNIHLLKWTLIFTKYSTVQTASLVKLPLYLSKKYTGL